MRPGYGEAEAEFSDVHATRPKPLPSACVSGISSLSEQASSYFPGTVHFAGAILTGVIRTSPSQRLSYHRADKVRHKQQRSKRAVIAGSRPRVKEISITQQMNRLDDKICKARAKASAEKSPKKRLDRVARYHRQRRDMFASQFFWYESHERLHVRETGNFSRQGERKMCTPDNACASEKNVYLVLCGNAQAQRQQNK